MARDYVNCPTCGTLCEYVSENFKIANTLIPIRGFSFEDKVKELVQANIELEYLLESKLRISNLSSQEILILYMIKVKEEFIQEQLEKDKLYDSIISKVDISLLRSKSLFEE